MTIRHTIFLLLAAVAAMTMALAPPVLAADRSISLVLDASGSMNGRLPDGVAKIDAAKAAVRDLVGKLPGDVRLSLRAYGHQSSRKDRDCRDTQLLVPFGGADSVRGDVISKCDALTAMGYTPITYVLGLAADDINPEGGEKIIVLVSDGKETCEGDPCLLAQKLAGADADLRIHTVGFGVDYQARTQLECIARAGRGQYYDAQSPDDLVASMREAANTEIEEQIVVIRPRMQDGKGIKGQVLFRDFCPSRLAPWLGRFV